MTDELSAGPEDPAGGSRPETGAGGAAEAAEAGGVPEAGGAAPRTGGALGPAEAGGAAGPADPAPLGLVRTPTGHPGVDAHLERLSDADHLPADGHVEVYEDVHRGLRDALTALDAPPVPGPYENRS